MRLLLALLAFPAWGTITLVRTPDFGGQVATIQTIPVTLGSNSTAGNLIIGVTSGTGATCVTATPTVGDSVGTSYSVVLKQLGNSNEVQWGFYGVAGGTGANTVTVDWGLTHVCLRGLAMVAEYSGVGAIDQSVSAGDADVGAASPADSGAMTTTTNANDLLFCGVRVTSDARTFTAGTYDGTNSYTIQYQQNTVNSSTVGDAVVSATGAYHCRMAFSTTSGRWMAHAFAFQASASATVPVVHKVSQ